MKQKVAICISGFVRDYERFHKSLFDNIIEYNKNYFEFDIFISTWDTRNTKISRSFIERKMNDFSDIDIEDIKRFYNPITNIKINLIV